MSILGSTTLVHHYLRVDLKLFVESHSHHAKRVATAFLVRLGGTIVTTHVLIETKNEKHASIKTKNALNRKRKTACMRAKTSTHDLSSPEYVSGWWY
jgi:CxxC motif-containing protein